MVLDSRSLKGVTIECCGWRWPNVVVCSVWMLQCCSLANCQITIGNREQWFGGHIDDVPLLLAVVVARLCCYLMSTRTMKKLECWCADWRQLIMLKIHSTGSLWTVPSMTLGVLPIISLYRLAWYHSVGQSIPVALCIYLLLTTVTYLRRHRHKVYSHMQSISFCSSSVVLLCL